MKLTEKQSTRLAEIQAHSPSYSGVFKKAFSAKSKAAALKAKCLDCCCWQKLEITTCTTSSCPLWPYRPYQKASAMNEILDHDDEMVSDDHTIEKTTI